MRILRLIALLFVCFSLPLNAMASSAMLCCKLKGVEQMQVDKGLSGMPCHKDASKSDSKHLNFCEKCQNCVATNAIMSSQGQYAVTFIPIHHGEYAIGFISYRFGDVYSPPKPIS